MICCYGLSSDIRYIREVKVKMTPCLQLAFK